MSKRINSRNKGKRGERAFRDVLREAGYLKARRGQQFSGEQGNPDVVCPELPEIHWEVKCCEKGNIYDWVDQANADSVSGCRVKNVLGYGMVPLAAVAHKRNGQRWLAILDMDDFLEIIRRSDLPNLIIDNTYDARAAKFLDAVGVSPSGKGKISIPVKR